jgi:hypothetical protein
VSELLTIDVAAEVAKLAAGGLEGAWQVPAELVRRSIACGARRVEVRLSRREVVVTDDAPLPATLASALATLLDAGAPADRRHASLLRLEASPAFGLIALASLTRTRVGLEPAATGSRLRLSGAEIDAGRAERWLRAVARLAPVPVRLAGEDLGVGFGPALAEAPAPAPARGRLALVADAQPARVFVLHHGVVAAHLVLPELTAFAAAVELGEEHPRSASPAALRESAGRHLAALVDGALELALRALPRAWDEAELASLRGLLLEAARNGRRRSDVLRAPLVGGLASAGAERRSLLELAASARGEPLWAIEPGADPERFLLPRTSVHVLGPGDRSRLAELLGLSFRTPPERPRPARRTLAELARDVAAAWRRSAATLRPGRRVPTTEQRPEERALLGALAALPGFGRAVLLDGAGAVHERRGAWAVPRRNPLVAAAARAAARDPGWAGAAALALLPPTSPAARGVIATGRAAPAPERRAPPTHR